MANGSHGDKLAMPHNVMVDMILMGYNYNGLLQVNLFAEFQTHNISVLKMECGIAQINIVHKVIVMAKKISMEIICQTYQEDKQFVDQTKLHYSVAVQEHF